MTTSIGYQVGNVVNIESLRKTVLLLLEKYLPTVSSTATEISDSMYAYLTGTLVFWMKKLTLDDEVLKIFLLTKTLEAFSFWDGFTKAGGNLPPKLVEHETCKHPKLAKSSCSKISCVIPIGPLSPMLESILIRSISNILSSERINQVVLVSDGFKNTLQISNPKLHEINLPNRRGPAVARNHGIKVALEDGCDTVFLLDSDVLFPVGEPDKFIEQFSRSKKHLGLPIVKSHGIGWMNEYHNVNGTLNGRYLSSDHLLYATTCCALISKDVFEHDLEFSPDFVDAASEDIDFSLRCLNEGYSIGAFDDNIVHHWYGYSGIPFEDIQVLHNRFSRYGSGEYILLAKHPYFYNLLAQTSIRSCSDAQLQLDRLWENLISGDELVANFIKIVKENV